MHQLPEAVIRGYAPWPNQKVLPFPKGTFFYESKIVIGLLPYIGQTAFILRVYLSSIARNTNGKREVRISPGGISKALKMSRATVYRTLDKLVIYGLIERDGLKIRLTEPPKTCLEVVPAPARRSPRQLNLF